jgi:hypothetical protein
MAFAKQPVEDNKGDKFALVVNVFLRIWRIAAMPGFLNARPCNPSKSCQLNLTGKNPVIQDLGYRVHLNSKTSISPEA